MSKHKHRLGLCIILAFSVFYATFGLSLPLLEQIFLAAILGASWGTIAFSGFMAVENELSDSDRAPYAPERVLIPLSISGFIPFSGLLSLMKLRSLQSPLWPSLEIAGAIVAMSFVLMNGVDARFVCTMIFFYVLAQISVFDLRERLINEKDLLALLIIALGLSIAYPYFPLTAQEAVTGALAGSGLLWLAQSLTQTLSRSDSVLGSGDIWLTAGLGAWVGYYIMPVLLIAACLACVQHLASRRRLVNFEYADRPTLLPLAPALCLAGFMGWMVLNKNYLV